MRKLDQRLGKTQTRNPWYWQNPEAVGMHADSVRHMHSALNNLPPKLRRIVRLAAVEGRSYKEIAETLDCPMGTVMSRLYRGRHLLRAVLQGHIAE